MKNTIVTTTQQELESNCKFIRKELEAIYNADFSDDEVERMEENGEAYDFYSYFDDVLDYEFIVSSRKEYLGAKIWVALGGPNIYIDTRHGEIVGHWGTDESHVWMSPEICAEIDAVFEDIYDF